MSSHNLSQQIEIKRSMLAAVSALPRLQNALRELSQAVNEAAKPEAVVDNETAIEAGVAIEQIAASLEMAAAELRGENRKLSAVYPVIVAR